LIFWGLLILLGKKLLEAIEAGIPELFVFQEPLGYIAQRLRGQLESVVAASAGAADESGTLEYAHVLAESGKRNGKRLSDIGDACGPAGEAIDDGAASAVGDGGGDGIKVSRGRAMVNHVVQYR